MLPIILYFVYLFIYFLLSGSQSFTIRYLLLNNADKLLFFIKCEEMIFPMYVALSDCL